MQCMIVVVCIEIATTATDKENSSVVSQQDMVPLNMIFTGGEMQQVTI